jgi:hypothetical protein
MINMKDFQLGIIVSASYLVSTFDQPTLSANLLYEHSITKDILKSIADSYDIKILLPLYESESILRGI